MYAILRADGSVTDIRHRAPARIEDFEEGAEVIEFARLPRGWDPSQALAFVNGEVVVDAAAAEASARLDALLDEAHVAAIVAQLDTIRRDPRRSADVADIDRAKDKITPAARQGGRTREGRP